MSMSFFAACRKVKLQFIAQCSVETVGAIIDRPRGRILRIRIGFRRIRNISLRGRGAPRSESTMTMIAGGNHTIMSQ